MWLFADSGSTKTEWRLVNKEGEYLKSVETQGLNPYFLTGTEITRTIREKVLEHMDHVERIFFYGAGCGLAAKADQMKSFISAALPGRSQIVVAGDILGAARSMLQDQRGISCILGTGANSCVYNGKTIEEMVPSLGYALSDWGSGTVMSKDFISLLLRQELPGYIREDFFDTYRLTQGQVLDKIYNKPLANRFLASFSPFLLKYSQEPEVRQVIMENFRKFFRYYVLQYPQFATNNAISVAGSIAYYYQSWLLEVAEELSVHVQTLTRHPMDGLVKFHCNTVQVTND